MFILQEKIYIFSAKEKENVELGHRVGALGRCSALSPHKAQQLAIFPKKWGSWLWLGLNKKVRWINKKMLDAVR